MNLEGLTEKRNRMGAVYYEDADGEIVARLCTKCDEIKELANFSKDKRKLGGVRSYCKGCESKRSRKYREENREKIAERNRKYREENREKIAESQRKYYEENREKIAERHSKYYEENRENIAKYYEENRDKIAERMRKYYEENRDKIAEVKRKYYEENRDKIAGYRRKFREENREKEAERSRKYYENNREKYYIYVARRLARKRSLPDTLTAEEYAKTLAYFGNACALTGETTDLHSEHAIPLAIGRGGTIRENMYPMAGRLNLSKGDRNIFEWFEANRKRFKLSQERFDRLIEWLGKANDMTVEEYRDYVYWCHDNPVEIDEEVAI
ncbi:hypothetical protein MKX29_23985 [Cytobacillus sp. FSL R7-0696]|uniref:hypothetical protein n=1 Tax=Cytobacillus sp. FSL R7-0696 TaxID=2921691 RepID=UPI0030F4B539